MDANQPSVIDEASIDEALAALDAWDDPAPPQPRPMRKRWAAIAEHLDNASGRRPRHLDALLIPMA